MEKQKHLFDYPSSPGAKERGGASQDAADKIVGRLSRLRRISYSALQGSDMTADEIAMSVGEDILSIRPRISEFRARGAVRATGHRRESSRGNSSTVWTIEGCTPLTEAT